ncbi:hypothetical protein, partial [Candidatus Ichthyocystis hellenicum]|uniref:hypothetical protein n=1 Tax=Candidatus Ichthyocystis hellenicum TaxID=1561003 RepID=UPI001F5FC215
ATPLVILSMLGGADGHQVANTSQYYLCQLRESVCRLISLGGSFNISDIIVSSFNKSVNLLKGEPPAFNYTVPLSINSNDTRPENSPLITQVWGMADSILRRLIVMVEKPGHFNIRVHAPNYNNCTVNNELLCSAPKSDVESTIERCCGDIRSYIEMEDSVHPTALPTTTESEIMNLTTVPTESPTTIALEIMNSTAVTTEFPTTIAPEIMSSTAVPTEIPVSPVSTPTTTTEAPHGKTKDIIILVSILAVLLFVSVAILLIVSGKCCTSRGARNNAVPQVTNEPNNGDGDGDEDLM